MTVNLLDGFTAESKEDDNETLSADTILGGYATVVQADSSDSYKVKKRVNGSDEKGYQVYAIEIAKQGKSSIEFTTNTRLKVIVPFSSNGGSNTSDLAIRNSAKEQVADTVNCTGLEFAAQVVVTLDAGTYEIYSPGDTTSGDNKTSGRGARLKTITFVAPDAEVEANKVAYFNDGSDDYAIAVIDGNNVENDDIQSFYIYNGDNKSEFFKEVYKSVKIGDVEYPKSVFTNDTDAYIYGFKVSNDENDTAEFIGKLAVGYNANTTTEEY
jgi:hypothetical protein